MGHRPDQPDVKYETLNFTLVGAFMVAMAREKPKRRPKTVKAFMRLLSCYLRAHAQTVSEDPGRLERAPNVPDQCPESHLFEARFIPNEGDTSKHPLGTWEVDAVLKVLNVRRDAKMRMFSNTASSVHIRLPEKGNIETKELLAQDLQARNERFPRLGYIEDYFAGKTTNMEFVWDNVGDYTTRSCR